MVKQCTKCKELKSISDFPKCSANKNGAYSSCKLCNSKKVKAYYKANKEERKSYQIKYERFKPTIEQKRKYLLKKKYGITIDQYNEMFANQNQSCAICKQIDKKLCVDHDHKTGKVRALLCSSCNIAIGLMKDNSEFCLAAANYLVQHNKDI